MLLSIILILLVGFVSGQLLGKLGAPPLIGMVLAGIALGSEGGDLIAPSVLERADDLRAIAVMVILMRAGLGLDREKLVRQGTVAIRLGFLPALTEAIAVAIGAIWLFEFDLITGLLLGCVVSAESPAVIVPGMLRLKSWGWGVAKGIPDVILTGSALSDVLVLLLFDLLLNFLVERGVSNNVIWLLPLQVIVQVVLGVIIGYAIARLIVEITVKWKWTQYAVQNTLIVASLALLTIVVSKFLSYSGYLATMAIGFFLIEFDPPLARQLRGEFNHLWIVAEIVLFVLLGASIQLSILENILLPGILLLTFSLLLGRTIGWYLSTLNSDWSWREKLFLLPGNSAKATVQAAIGAIPLSLGVEGGEIILAIAALAILVTAPLGAWAIPTFAPKLLTKDPVDPTKVNIVSRTILLALVDSKTATKVLTATADFARRSNGEVIILSLHNNAQTESKQLESIAANLLLDIRYQFLELTNFTSDELWQLVNQYQVTNLIVGNNSQSKAIASVFEQILSASLVPVTLV